MQLECLLGAAMVGAMAMSSGSLSFMAMLAGIAAGHVDLAVEV